MRSIPLSASLLAVLLCWMIPVDAKGQFQAGAAKIDITPAMGVSLDGPISKNGMVTSVHDPLHARALVLSDGQIELGIVVVDQCMTGRDVFDAAKEKVNRAIGLPVDRMLMAATHTHAAPRTIHLGREPIDDAYHLQLADDIARAVIAAHRRLAPAKIGFASFRNPDLIACRRSVCEPGSVGINPFGLGGERVKSVAGKSTAVIGPAGPTDPEFSVVSVQHADGTPLCLLGNFSVHYCGGYRPGAVSADYFGQFAAAVESSLPVKSPHPPMVAIMSNGTSGDTGSFQRTDGKSFSPFEAMQHFGRRLAEEAIESIKNVDYRGDLRLQMKQREIELGVRRPDADQIGWAEEMLDRASSEHPHRWTRTYAEEAIHLSKYPPTQSIVLQAIRIGDIGIAAAPCEIFAETGLAIKEQSPLQDTFVMELANGYGGYLPTLQQHQWGGYETWPARSSLLEVAAEEKIRNGLLGLLSEVDRAP